MKEEKSPEKVGDGSPGTPAEKLCNSISTFISIKVCIVCLLLLAAGDDDDRKPKRVFGSNGLPRVQTKHKEYDEFKPPLLPKVRREPEEER